MIDENAHLATLLDQVDATIEPAPSSPNRQLFANSPLAASEAYTDYKENPDKLYGDKDPNLAILREKPEHRVVIFLKAQGLSDLEIAKRTGLTNTWISQVLRQPWARQRLIQELSSAGRDAVQELIKASAEDSVFTLIEQRDNLKAKPSERIAAANSLLDRFLGKPTQRVESHNMSVHGSLKDLDEINRELAKLEIESARLTGN